MRMAIGIGGVSHAAEDYEAVLASGSAAPPDVAIDGRDVAYLIYTSGTTGRPRV
jgi:fatty-acyl-CoA synthase